MSNEIKVCVDRVLPSDMQREAESKAIAENPLNMPAPGAPAPLSGAVDARKLWAAGSVVRVCFLVGIESVLE